MKLACPLIILALLATAFGDAPVSLPLTDGSVIKGEITSAGESEVTVSTEFGTVRIPAHRLTETARKAAGLDSAPPKDAGSQAALIARLEARIRALETENARLKAIAGAQPLPPGGGAQRITPEQKPAGLSWSISSTGKRHNSRCRYYGSGRAGGSGEGIACKHCGG